MDELLLADSFIQSLTKFQNLWIGFSGGLDSTVLLHVLSRYPDLASKLTAVHVHHGLSENADQWLHHCQTFCEAYQIPLVIRHVVLDGLSNIEEQARTRRYEVFSSLVELNDALLLAHHVDDQAETVLLNLLRGTGIDGLSGMSMTSFWKKTRLIRPLLNYSRETLCHYARDHQLSWIDDESNQDERFSRNYLRHRIFPLLQARWGGVSANLSRTAQHCQQAKENLHNLANLDCMDLQLKQPTLSLERLQTLAYARAANVLRTWLSVQQVRIPSTLEFEELLKQALTARQDALISFQWGMITIKRYRAKLYLIKSSHPGKNQIWHHFPNELVLGDDMGVLHARRSEQGVCILDSSRIEIRYRDGGEVLYWRGRHRTLKKLFQSWNIPPWERDRIPLLWIDGQLAAVIGFAVNDDYSGDHSSNAYHIERI